MARSAKHLVLVGGGHAHVAVIADWIRNGQPFESATLLTPHTTLRYSGMVPGWIAGRYDRDIGTVDLMGLAERAGIDVVLDKCVDIDPERCQIETQGGSRLVFDIASIDTGGIGRGADILGEHPRLLDVRPIDGFVGRLAEATKLDRVAVIGGGAGGVELSFALRNYAGIPAPPHVTLVSGEQGLLPNLSSAVRRKVATELRRQGIACIQQDAQLLDGQLWAGDKLLEPIDHIIAALGSGAPHWPKASGLACDDAGFIAVDRFQRSTSHSHIYATGDVASRQDRRIAHSGVHAVFAGPILSSNLRSEAVGDEPRRSYTPRANSLYLLNCGNGEAIASYGPFSAKGRWVARLKHWIDIRWINKYADLAKTE